MQKPYTFLLNLTKNKKIFIFVTVFLVITAVVASISTYYFYKYWYPPMMVLTPEDLGTKAIINTNLGSIEVTFDQRARFPVSQFTRLARSGFYDNTKIHRIVKNLLIEGGDPLTKDKSFRKFWGSGGSADVFKNETHNYDKMESGVFAFSGSAAGTYGSHFFILTKDTPWMKGQHTILGKITAGMEVVKEIEKTETDSMDYPKVEITIENIKIL